MPEVVNGDAGNRKVAGEGRSAEAPASPELHRYPEAPGLRHAKPLANLAFSKLVFCSTDSPVLLANVDVL